MMTTRRQAGGRGRLRASAAGLVGAAAMGVVALAAHAGTAAAAPSALARPSSSRSPASVSGQGAASPVPILAYYYIWFNATSWNRAKVDYPLVGRYSSDDVAVMREQVRLAMRAGITGFMVSWKNTPSLDSRLAKLRAVAYAAHFKLAIVFEGRDFHGSPLPMSEVDGSFAYLAAHYAHDPVFNLFGKPMVMWSGTWAYTRPQLASITRAYGSRLVILASEKQVAAYNAVASLFQGDSYYWSSADPLRTPGYAQKLDEFSAAVHQHGGLWIAPAAPGFDARLVGGVRIVPRRGGQTLRAAMNAAIDSSPDAVGLISWNEYSENSEVEPSRDNGTTALKTLASLNHAKPPAVSAFDSNGPAGFSAGPAPFILVGALAALLGGSILVIFLRRGRAR